MASLADKLKQAAALMKKGGEEKKEINSSLGLPPAAPITATKTTAQTTVTDLNEHKEVVKDISVSLGIADPDNYTPPKFSAIREATTQTVNDLNNCKQSSYTFYKCASVDTENKKWGGYKTSIDPVTGVWSFAESETPDLPYNKIIPQVGKVYDGGCTFMASLFDMGMLVPSDGLVFYAPLSTDYTDIIGGSAVTHTPTGGTFTTYKGKACLETPEWTNDHSIDPRVIWDFASPDRPTVTDAFSIFCLIAWDTHLDGDWAYPFLFSDNNESNCAALKGADGTLQLEIDESRYYNGDADIDRNSPHGWCSFCGTRDASGNVRVYYNAMETGTGTNTSTIGSQYVCIGGFPNGNRLTRGGLYADCCIYNRALTADEVLSMHNNLMPQ